MKKSIAFVICIMILVYPMVGFAMEIEPYGVNVVSAYIDSVSGKKVSYSGSATFSLTEDSIALSVTIQEKQGTDWVNIDAAYATKTKASIISASKTTTVTGGGRTYRIKSYAVATTGYSTTYKTAYSPTFTVN